MLAGEFPDSRGGSFRREPVVRRGERLLSSFPRKRSAALVQRYLALAAIPLRAAKQQAANAETKDLSWDDVEPMISSAVSSSSTRERRLLIDRGYQEALQLFGGELAELPATEAAFHCDGAEVRTLHATQQCALTLE
jgi:hypothetical protein